MIGATLLFSNTHTPMGISTSSPLVRALKLGTVATASLYMLVALVAEPLHGIAASDSENAIVQVTVAAGIGLACDAENDNDFGSGETLNLGTITQTGDTGLYALTKQVTCKVSTNNGAGYNLTWLVANGSGGNGTGHLISAAEDKITAIGTGSMTNTMTWPTDTFDSRWGGRVSSTSSGTQVNDLDFGTDVSSEKYARVATGTAVAIRQKSSAAQNGGDRIRIHFRAYVGANKAQPTGTYLTTVTFTGNTL